jgi:hypothetical protein
VNVERSTTARALVVPVLGVIRHVDGGWWGTLAAVGGALHLTGWVWDGVLWRRATVGARVERGPRPSRDQRALAIVTEAVASGRRVTVRPDAAARDCVLFLGPAGFAALAAHALELGPRAACVRASQLRRANAG